MAKYLILIYGDEQRWDAESEQERHEKGEGHRAFSAAATVLAGHELEPSTTATTLRGGPMITDGPFLEAKEALGGFYVIDAADLDAAIAAASMLPELASGHGGVEIRPIVDHDRPDHG
ncbi:YciI family protein [Dactylosporangium sp. NPDC005555]|uniref:YciI family protein n=1 Tax=Dactylosporangium sp. NPDC005555 TaxID=3154889 RepID=UPI0033A6DDD9